MNDEKVKMEYEEKIAVLTIDSPPANAISPEVREEFLDKLHGLAQNENIWTIIITGSGDKFFVGGADIPKLLDLDQKSGLERVKKAREFYSGIAHFEKPVIAAINGLCLGGGLELALACDIRIAAQHARLGLPEVNLGLIPGAGGTQRLPRAIGPGWANYLLFTGEAITAEQAFQIGLVQKVVKIAELKSAALNIANKINSKAPLAVRAVKKAAAEGIELPLEKGLDLENVLFSEICATHDKNEGIRAFLEKRKPIFQGK